MSWYMRHKWLNTYDDKSYWREDPTGDNRGYSKLPARAAAAAYLRHERHHGWRCVPVGHGLTWHGVYSKKSEILFSWREPREKTE